MTVRSSGPVAVSAHRWAVPLGTWVAAPVAVLLTGFMLGRAYDHYCQSTPYRPEGATAMTGPSFSSPVTLRCWYDNVGWVAIPDTRPLRIFLTNLSVAVLVAWVLSGVIAIRRRARSSAA